MGVGTAVAANNTITFATSAGVSVSSASRFAVMTAAEIVTNVGVTYSSRDTTGELHYTTQADQFGTVFVTLTTLDAGVDGLFSTADDLSVVKVVQISVTPVNDAPTLDAVSEQVVAEDSGANSVALTGITPRPGNELEDIRLSHSLQVSTTVAIAVGANVIGETITVGCTTFSYVDAATTASPTATQIAVNSTDSTIQVASLTAMPSTASLVRAVRSLRTIRLTQP